MPSVGWSQTYFDRFTSGTDPYWSPAGRINCYSGTDPCYWWMYRNGYAWICHGTHTCWYHKAVARAERSACISVSTRAGMDTFANNTPIIVRMGPPASGITGYGFGRYLSPHDRVELRRYCANTYSVVCYAANTRANNATRYNVEVIPIAGGVKVRAWFVAYGSYQCYSDSCVLFCYTDCAALPPGKVGFHAYTTASAALTWLFQYRLETVDADPGCATATGLRAIVTGSEGGCWRYRALLPYRIYDRPTQSNLEALRDGRYLLPYLVYDRKVQANFVAIARGILEHKRRGQVLLPYRVLNCQGNLQADFEALKDAFPE